MLGVIVPAHNEADYIEACLASIAVAATHPLLLSEAVVVVVAMDDCSDDTESLALGRMALLAASGCALKLVSSSARKVGVSRAIGAEAAIEAGARWLAFTDADCEVEADWLAAQLALEAEFVCGVIMVRDWAEYGEVMQQHFQATYVDADDHRHVHGANLGISAPAYRHLGGFEPLACHEDKALVASWQARGGSVAWSSAPRVVTSSRRAYRAPDGFGATLERISLSGDYFKPIGLHP